MEETLKLHLSHLPALVDPVESVQISNNSKATVLDDILLEKLKNLKSKCHSLDSDRCGDIEAASKDNNEDTKDGTREQDDDGDRLWTFDKVLDHRTEQNGKVEVEILWDNGETSWEPLSIIIKDDEPFLIVDKKNNICPTMRFALKCNRQFILYMINFRIDPNIFPTP